LRRIMDADEDEQEKDVKELGQTAARLDSRQGGAAGGARMKGMWIEDMEELLEMMEKLQLAAEGSAAADAKLPEGWSEVAGAEKRFLGPGGAEAGLLDLPVFAYMATLKRYFGGMQESELARVHAMTMTSGESLQAWGARVMAQVQLANEAFCPGRPTEQRISKAQELQIFTDGIHQDGRYAAHLVEVMPQVRQLAAEERSIARIMGMVQRVLDDKKGEEMQTALRKAAAGQAGVKEPRYAAGRSDGQAAAQGDGKVWIPRKGGVKAISAGLRQMDLAAKEQTLRLLLEEKGMSEQVLGGGHRAVAAVGAGAGLRQARMMQQQQGGAGGAGAGQGCQADTLDCQCRHPRHPAGVVCWVTNPHLAPADWRPPQAGPDNEVYQRNCHRTCVQPRLAGGDRRREQQQRPQQQQQPQQQQAAAAEAAAGSRQGRASSSQRVGASGWPTGRTQACACHHRTGGSSTSARQRMAQAGWRDPRTAERLGVA
jgi:hypothetical protein